ncbi:MAG: type IV secretion system protein, partial [Phycisphaerae bacterium]
MTLINETLQQYLDAINSGFGFIDGDVRWVFNALVVLNIVMAALFWAFSDDQVVVALIRKVIYIGIFAWIIENWVELTNILANTFMLLGLKAGGGTLDQDIMLNPGKIADRGLTTITPMMQAIRDLSGPVAFFENFIEIILLALAVLMVLIAFFLIAIQAVMAVLTFKLGSLAAFILIPFSLVTHTAFMAERPLGWVVTASVRLMLLTIVVGLGEAMFANLEINPDEVTVRAALDIARRRGELMNEAAAKPGAMLAVSAPIEDIEARISKSGV